MLAELFGCLGFFGVMPVGWRSNPAAVPGISKAAPARNLADFAARKHETSRAKGEGGRIQLRLATSRSQGVRWKPAISRYIGTMPLSMEAPGPGMHIMSWPP